MLKAYLVNSSQSCHIFSAGYDIRTKKGFDKTFDKFDSVIGLKFLKCFHVNDSKTDFESRKDRHESLGKGKIGIDAFKFLMKDKRFQNIPKILETPNDKIWKDEIEILNEYEGLAYEDIQACFLFATKYLKDTAFMALSEEAV